MAYCKLKDDVQDLEGNPSTLEELVRCGKARLEKLHNYRYWHRGTYELRVAYMCVLLDSQGQLSDLMFEISPQEFSRAQSGENGLPGGQAETDTRASCSECGAVFSGRESLEAESSHIASDTQLRQAVQPFLSIAEDLRRQYPQGRDQHVLLNVNGRRLILADFLALKAAAGTHGGMSRGSRNHSKQNPPRHGRERDRRYR